MANNHFTKKFLILPVLLVVFGLSGCDMKWGTQKGEFQEFDLNGTKVSFIPPHGWECGVFPLQFKSYREKGINALLCAKEISPDIMNTVESNYINSKGNGPYYDEIVKNDFGEVFFMFLEDLTEEKRQYILNDDNFNTEYSKSQLMTIGGKQFRSRIITRGQKNSSGILMLGEKKKVIMINILPEYRTAHITPTKKVRKILETISIEENNVQ